MLLAQSAFSIIRDRASFVRSTATARPPQRKGRCIQVEPLVSRCARLHSPVLSRPRGVNSDTRRPLGTRRNACGYRRDISICLIKTGFDQCGRRGLGLDSVSNSRDAAAASPPTTAQPSIAAAPDDETAAAPRASAAPSSESTVAALHARAASCQSLRRQTTKPQHPEPSTARGSDALLPRETAPRRPWARKKKKMTSPRPST